MEAVSPLRTSVSIAPPFFIYAERAFNQSDVLRCFPRWRLDDQAAEVSMLQQLEGHPARVHDKADADVFVIPLFPYVSSIAGECSGVKYAAPANSNRSV
jgi:hypothetical protein